MAKNQRPFSQRLLTFIPLPYGHRCAYLPPSRETSTWISLKAALRVAVSRFSFLVSPTILFCSRLQEEPGRCHASLYRCTVKFSVNRQPTPFFFSSSLSFFFFITLFPFLPKSFDRIWESFFGYEILLYAVNEIQMNCTELFSHENNEYQNYDSFVLQMLRFIFSVVNVRRYIFFTICRQSEFNFFQNKGKDLNKLYYKFS